MKLLLTNLKHFLITLTILAAIAIGVAVKFGADIYYGDNEAYASLHLLAD